MLAELFMLRMEAIARSIDPRIVISSDTRFVPIKLPAAPVKTSQPPSKTA